MAVVCFRARSASVVTQGADADALNERLLTLVNETGETYLTHTRLHGRLALRVAVGNVLTAERHLARAWELIRVQFEVVSGGSV
jgi:aromatic-L-amino-acid decarboxylase